MWLGTHYRLHRFDGYQLDHFPSKNKIDKGYYFEYSESDQEGLFWYVYKFDDSYQANSSKLISNDAIRVLYRELHLKIYNPFDHTYVELSELLPEINWNIRKVIRLKRNKNSLLILLDNNTFVKYSSREDWSLETIPLTHTCYDVQIDSNGNIYAVTENGIVKINIAKLEKHSIENIPHCQVLEIEVDSKNKLWILYRNEDRLQVGTLEDGYSPVIHKSLSYDRRIIQRTNIFQVQVLSPNQYLIRILREGYLISNKDTMNLNSFLNEDTFIPIADIKAESERIYLGTDNGAYILIPKINYFKNLFRGDTILNSCRGIILNDKFFYLNSYTGLRFTRNLDDLTDLDVYKKRLYGKSAFYDTVSQKIYSASHSFKQMYFDLKDYSIGNISLPAKNNNANQVMRSSITGKLIVLGNSGFFEITNDDSVIPINPLNDFLSDKYVRNARLFEIDSTLWITSTSGLISFNYNTNQIESYDENNSCIGDLGVNFILQENDSVYWLASNTSGLIRWNQFENSCEVITTTQGLSDNLIYSIYKDSLNRLWMPSNNGLNCYDHLNKQNIIYYDSDGLAHNEFNRYSDFKDSKGLLYFGGLNGITYFKPETVQSFDNFDINVRFKNITLQDENGNIINISLNEKNTIRFDEYNQGLKLDLFTNDLFEANSIKYFYRIKGVVNEWQIQNNNQIFLPRIPPGKHLLEIAAQKPGYARSKSKRLINLIVPYPFHQSKLFYFLLLIGIALLTWAYIKIRTNYLEKRALRLTRLIEEKTEELRKANAKKDKLFWLLAHDLKGPLNALNNMNQKLSYLLKKNKLKRAFNLSEDVDKSVHSLNDNLNNIIQWALKDQNMIPHNPESLILKQYVENSINLYLEICNEKDLKITNDVHIDVKVYMDKTALQTILRNILHNAIKFSPLGGTIQINYFQKSSAMGLLMIQDEGPGMKAGNKQEKGFGLGLVIVKELLKINNGKLLIESDNKGTTVLLKLPTILQTS